MAKAEATRTGSGEHTLLPLLPTGCTGSIMSVNVPEAPRLLSVVPVLLPLPRPYRPNSHEEVRNG
jgi:hypothetical protein